MILFGVQSKVEQVFNKGYRQAWSEEIYTVKAIEKSMGFCLYILQTDDGRVLPRKFYSLELNFISRNEPPLNVSQ